MCALKIITIIRFKKYLFLENVEIIHGNLTPFLNYRFLKYIMVSHYIYIYIYDLEFNWI